MTAVEPGTVEAQVDRILRSDTFRNSESLRRLLRYLADKSATGQANQLKEYSIGLDAFGKPPSYDPRQDSIVRLQVGRLRQRLSDYYSSEGKDDPVLIDLPKGHFRLNFESRVPNVEEEPASPLAAPVQPDFDIWRPVAIGLAGLLLVVSLAAMYFARRTPPAPADALVRSHWTPELEALWSPFLDGKRPLIISAGSPMFVRMGRTLVRDLSLNRWEDVPKSHSITATQAALQQPEIFPDFHYAPFGEVSSAFRLGSLLASRDLNVSFSKTVQLSWQQLADNNVLIIGSPSFLGQLRGMPSKDAFGLEPGGVRNLDPKPGESAFFTDILSPVAEDGEVYGLITRTAGPLGQGEVAAFTSNQTPGRMAGIEWFTDATLARTLVSKLKSPDGTIPRYYQVLLKVNYKDGVPIETSYVTHRQLNLVNHPAESQP